MKRHRWMLLLDRVNLKIKQKCSVCGMFRGEAGLECAP